MTGELMKHFLIQYDRSEHRLARCEQFTNSDAAYAAYAALEKAHVFDDRYEIVLLGARSLETLKVTHAHYFTPNGNLAQVLSRTTAG
jgi:hypothetical protein